MNVAFLVLAFSVLGQVPPSEADLKLILFPYYAGQAATYDFFLDENRTQRLELKQQPILTWTNAADRYLGGVFVWTWGGRPELVGCIGSIQTAEGECRVFNELHSLSAAAIQPVKFGDGNRLWQPPSRGVELHDLGEEKDAADSERERLTYMRNLARTFRGWMKQGSDITELRLLPQPIFRYSAPARGIADGALFALVSKGTDPEILLMLESHTSLGKQTWKYALVRFNWCELWASHDDVEVLRMPQTGMVNDKPFISGRVRITTLAAIREATPE